MKKRAHILAFYGVPASSGTGVTFTRMKYFTQLSHSKNAQEYSRKYVDEESDRIDVSAYKPQYDYGFDRVDGDPVLTDILKITNEELIGDDAVRTLLIVDTDTNEAYQRDYAVIPGQEGDDAYVYTHSGSMKAHGPKIKGTAASTDDWATATFTAVP